MKNLSILLMGAALAALIFSALVTDGAAANSEPRKLRHVVAFKFKDSATPQQIKEVEAAFRALKTKIPVIKEYEWGTNNSPEGLNKGFTHGFILTFHSEADRDSYLPHPEHKKFGAQLGPILEDVFVIDFWSLP